MDLFKYKKIKTSLFIILILLFNFAQSIDLRSIRANPVIFGKRIGIGGITYPNSSYYLQWEDAEVNFKINSQHYREKLKVNFEGVYFIKNLNQTVEITIGAPFEDYFEGLNDSLEVFVNDNQVKSIIKYMNATDLSDWREYIQDYYTGKYFVLTNVTFLENTVTEIRYNWKSIIKIEGRDSFSSVTYDVGTGRTWNDTIKEEVTMRVFGRKPDFNTQNIDYEINEDNELIILNKVKEHHFIPFHKYIWKWEDQPIMVNALEIGFNLNPPHYPMDIKSYFYPMIAGILTVSILVIGSFRVVERARRKEGLS